MSDSTAPLVVSTPCHGVVTNPALAADQAGWVGIFPGEAELLVEHVRQSVKLAHAFNAFWSPSGDVTRVGTALSEAQSAVNLAEAAEWWGCPEVARNTLIEDSAACSLQNLGHLEK